MPWMILTEHTFEQPANLARLERPISVRLIHIKPDQGLASCPNGGFFVIRKFIYDEENAKAAYEKLYEAWFTDEWDSWLAEWQANGG